MMTNQTNEFVASSTLKDASTPAICPCCGGAATRETKVLAYNFQSSTGEIIMFGLLGQLFRFVAFGSDSTSLLTLRLCERCNGTVVLYKTLEWIARLGGILLTIFFLLSQSSEEEPLIKRGAGPIILTFIPLVPGAILSYICRSRHDKSKGVVFIRNEAGKNWFRVQSADWLHEFSLMSPVIEIRKMDDEKKSPDNAIATVLAARPAPNTDMSSQKNSRLIQLHNLLHEQKKKAFGGSVTSKIEEVLNDLAPTQEEALGLLNSYFALFKADLIKELTNISNQYNTIKQNVSLFIDFDIVNDTYPHDRKHHG